MITPEDRRVLEGVLANYNFAWAEGRAFSFLYFTWRQDRGDLWTMDVVQESRDNYGRFVQISSG